MGLPGLCGFIAEVFVVLAAFNYSLLASVLAASAVILTAGYILWTLQRVFLGRSEQYVGLPDLNIREWIISIPLVLFTVGLGVFPQTLLLKWMGPSVDQMVYAVVKAPTVNPTPAPQAALSSPPGEASPRSLVSAGPSAR
jgi:NADH-quinone oxidoreductase subunit M